MTAEEFLKQVSPNDEFGIRADLKAGKIEKHVIDIMERYAALRIHDVVGRSERLPSCDKCGYYIHPDNKKCLREGGENY